MKIETVHVGNTRDRLLGLKQRALHNFMNKRRRPNSLGRAFSQNFLDRRAVGKADGGTGGIDDEIVREISRDRFLLVNQKLFKLIEVGKCAAIG